MSGSFRIEDDGDLKIDPMLASLPSPATILKEAMDRFAGMCEPSPHRLLNDPIAARKYLAIVTEYVDRHPVTKMRQKLMAMRRPVLFAYPEQGESSI